MRFKRSPIVLHICIDWTMRFHSCFFLFNITISRNSPWLPWQLGTITSLWLRFPATLSLMKCSTSHLTLSTSGNNSFRTTAIWNAVRVWFFAQKHKPKIYNNYHFSVHRPWSADDIFPHSVFIFFYLIVSSWFVFSSFQFRFVWNRCSVEVCMKYTVFPLPFAIICERRVLCAMAGISMRWNESINDCVYSMYECSKHLP